MDPYDEGIFVTVVLVSEFQTVAEHGILNVNSINWKHLLLFKSKHWFNYFTFKMQNVSVKICSFFWMISKKCVSWKIYFLNSKRVPRQRIVPSELCSNATEQVEITHSSAASLFLLDYVTVQWYPKFPARYSEFPLNNQQHRVDISVNHFTSFILNHSHS